MKTDMALFEGISDQAQRLVKVGSKKLNNTGKMASLSYSNKTEEDAIKKLYCELGERYYKAHGLNPGPGYEAICDKITEAKTRITANKALITELKIDGVVDDEVVDPEDVE